MKKSIVPIQVPEFEELNANILPPDEQIESAEEN
jgi:hypothetical protein